MYNTEFLLKVPEECRGRFFNHLSSSELELLSTELPLLVWCFCGRATTSCREKRGRTSSGKTMKLPIRIESRKRRRTLCLENRNNESEGRQSSCNTNAATSFHTRRPFIKYVVGFGQPAPWATDCRSRDSLVKVNDPSLYVPADNITCLCFIKALHQGRVPYINEIQSLNEIHRRWDGINACEGPIPITVPPNDIDITYQASDADSQSLTVPPEQYLTVFSHLNILRQKVRRHLVSKNITYQEAAKQMGLAKGTLSIWMNHDNRVTAVVSSRILLWLKRVDGEN